MNTTISSPRKTAFINAPSDVANSTYLLKLYVEGNENANYFYSKKEGHLESSDKNLLFLNMLNRFIVKNKCFAENPRWKASHYLEVYAKSSQHKFDILVFRCFSPTSPVSSKYEFFNNHFGLQQASIATRVRSICESSTIAQPGPIQPAQFNSSKDFHFRPFKCKKDWDKHLADLLKKYGNCAEVNNYRDQYERLYHANIQFQSPQVFISQRTNKLMQTFNEFKRLIYNQIGKNEFDQFFKSLYLIDFKLNTLKLQCQSDQHFQILESKYLEVIKTALAASFKEYIYDKPIRLEYLILNS